MPRWWHFALVLAFATPAAAQDMALNQILLPGESWRPVVEGLQSVDVLTANRQGEVFLAVGNDKGKSLIRLDKQGLPTILASLSAAVTGLTVGPDNLLYGCQPDRKCIVRFDAEGKEKPVAQDLAASAVCVTSKGALYCCVPGEKAVYLIDADGKKRKVAEGIGEPSGLVLWRDEGTLVVADASSKYLWTFRVEPDGSLTSKEGYYTLRVPRGEKAFKVTQLIVDQAGRLYAATDLGVQIFDPTGRMSGVLTKPSPEPVSALTIGGPERDLLYIVCGNKMFVRKTQAKGFIPGK
jgi:sugar lactone lactonase YvrE